MNSQTQETEIQKSPTPRGNSSNNLPPKVSILRQVRWQAPQAALPGQVKKTWIPVLHGIDATPTVKFDGHLPPAEDHEQHREFSLWHQ